MLHTSLLHSPLDTVTWSQEGEDMGPQTQLNIGIPIIVQEEVNDY